jgi:hypothetical protein
LIAWRDFFVENVLIAVLIGVIAIAVLRGQGGVLIGPLVVALAAVIMQILWDRR